jgi:hypothetical protein
MSETRIKTPEQLFEDDLVSTAIHEAGHFHMALFWDIPATLQINLDDAGNIIDGECRWGFVRPSFESATIGWGGIEAEYLLNRVWRHGPPLLFCPLTEKNIVKWHAEGTFFLNRLSDTDRQLIIGHQASLESCQFTFRILSKRIKEVEADAKLLADRTRKEIAAKRAAVHEADAQKWQGIPRPSAFPASHDDFIRLVCSSDPPRFERFIVSRAALHLTNGRTSEISDAKLSLGKSFDDAYAISLQFQRDIYAGDYKDESAWLKAAREFQLWAGSEGK